MANLTAAEVLPWVAFFLIFFALPKVWAWVEKRHNRKQRQRLARMRRERGLPWKR